jgi:hypothetical protein
MVAGAPLMVSFAIRFLLAGIDCIATIALFTTTVAVARVQVMVLLPSQISYVMEYVPLGVWRYC